MEVQEHLALPHHEDRDREVPARVLFLHGVRVLQASFGRGITERSYLARNIFGRRVVGEEEKS